MLIGSYPAVDYRLFRGLIVSGTQSGGRAYSTFCVNSVTCLVALF